MGPDTADGPVLRHSRHLLLKEFDETSLQTLSKSRALIIGAGGLGCPAALYLASAGIGSLRWVDDDCVELSNLPRQILFNDSDIGKKKVIAGKVALENLFPETKIEALPRRVDKKNIKQLFNGCDIILDCTDNFSSRQLNNKTSINMNIPLVIGGAVGWSGQLMVVDPRLKNEACYACVFEDSQSFKDDSCGAFGVFSPAVGTIGVLQAGETIKTLLSIKKTSGKLVLFDVLSNEFSTIRLKKNYSCKICGKEID